MGITGLKTLCGIGLLWALTKTGLEWTNNMPWIREVFMDSSERGRELFAMLPAVSYPTTVEIFGASACLYGLLVFFEHRKASRGRIRFGWGNSEPCPRSQGQGDGPERGERVGGYSWNQVCQIWDDLEESDREIVREIVIKGGLMESDITALLKARGFIQHDHAYEPIAERVPFIQCDFMGYHSIVPAWKSWLCGKIREELRDESFLAGNG